MQIIAAARINAVAVELCVKPLNHDESRRSPFCREMTSISRDAGKEVCTAETKSPVVMLAASKIAFNGFVTLL